MSLEEFNTKTQRHEGTKSGGSLPWYKDGLPFKCTQCGKCCTGAPGFVWVNDVEIAEMAEFLNIPIPTFKRLYLRQRDNRYLLIEKKSQNHDCVFFKDNKCTVYEARPTQCRTYPFWQENLISENSWKSTAEYCEGINDQSPLNPYSEIQKMLPVDSNEHFVTE
ncbi:MAG: YkgJ family cysteine cluster protein [Parachlamydiaceae bacterium]|nr:YkgJ family cysteine cluster protein [Parachlamydiaceae bacterium]